MWNKRQRTCKKEKKCDRWPKKKPRTSIIVHFEHFSFLCGIANIQTQSKTDLCDYHCSHMWKTPDPCITPHHFHWNKLSRNGAQQLIPSCCNCGFVSGFFLCNFNNLQNVSLCFKRTSEKQGIYFFTNKSNTFSAGTQLNFRHVFFFFHVQAVEWGKM